MSPINRQRLSRLSSQRRLRSSNNSAVTVEDPSLRWDDNGKIKTLLKRFCLDKNGLAALEFALAAPILILICFGGYELARFTLLTLKMEKIAFTIADVTSQNETLTNSQINDIFEAAGQIASPFEFDTLGIAYVSSAYLAEGDAFPTVLWQRSGGGTASFVSQVGTEGLTATLPNGLTLNERDNAIIAEVYYQYTPLFPVGVVSAKTIYKSTVFKPRLGDLTTSPT